MNLRSVTPAISCALGVLLIAGTPSVQAQQPGPMKPPSSAKPTVPLTANKPEPPPIPPEEIIQRFAANEDEMVRAILGYGFQKSVRLEEIGPDNKPAGQIEITTQQIVTPEGKRYEKPIRRTQSTLHYLQVERGDAELIASTPLFPLTTSQLPKYNISFEGKQPLDELNAYIFAVKPRSLERAHAYFSGVVWVDVDDLVIVKSIGKWVSEMGDVKSATLPFTVFETYRQQVGKHQWFPAYSRSDEHLPQGSGTVPIRMIIRWTDYVPLANAPAAPAPTPADKQ
jgi:hypothetical protein